MMEQMVEQFDRWVQQLGSAGYLLLGLAALLEYVVPPFPGDTVMLLGGAYAVRGEKSVALVVGVVTLGSVLGLGLMYGVGRLIGARVDRFPEGKLGFGITHARIRQLQDQMRSRGSWLLVANRFLPSFRAVLFIAAGAAKMSFARVALLGTISALVWNLVMVTIGYAVGGNVERLTALLDQYNRVAFVVVGVAVFGLVGRYLLKRRARA